MDNFVKVQLRIGKDGRFTRKIIRDGKSVCESGDDNIFLDDLLNIEMPDFNGKFGEVSTDGFTEEGEAAIISKIKGTNAPEWTPDDDDDDAPKGKKQKDRKKMDLGFGV